MKLKKQRQEISRTTSRAEVCKTTAQLGKSVEGVQIAQKDHLAGKVTLSCPPPSPPPSLVLQDVLMLNAGLCQLSGSEVIWCWVVPGFYCWVVPAGWCWCMNAGWLCLPGCAIMS